MATFKKYPKKPKAPRANAPLASHNKFAEAVKAYEKKCRDIDNENAALKRAQDQTKKLKAKISK